MSKPVPRQQARLSRREEPGAAALVGFWAAAVLTAAGAAYLVFIVVVMLLGQFTFPPPQYVQTFGGVSSLLMCPLLVALLAAVHETAPDDKKIFSRIALALTLLFAAAVSVNRFTQFGAFRLNAGLGESEMLAWFDPYGERSAMFGLELLGWGWFLGLAWLAAAPVLRGNWLRGLALLYAALGLGCAVAYLFSSPLSVIGFAAWGLVLPIITALLARDFRRA